MAEGKSLEQSNTDSTGIQSDIKAQQVFQADTIHVHGGDTSTIYQGKLSSRNSTEPPIQQETYAVFSIEGSIKDPVQLAKLKALVKSLQKITGDTSLEIEYVEEGSIKITLKGSSKALDDLKELLDKGELEKLIDVPISINEIEILDSSFLQKEKTNTNQLKPLLISAIQNNKKFGLHINKSDLSGANLSGANLSKADLSRTYLSGANLSGADLSGADLSGANLSRVNFTSSGASLSRVDFIGSGGYLIIGANLSKANLSKANLNEADLRRVNLSGANLSSADLSGADLSEADLSGADLSSADLSGADLSGANFSRVNVKNTGFINTTGLIKNQKAELKSRGAIFEDSPDDRSEVHSPVPE